MGIPLKKYYFHFFIFMLSLLLISSPTFSYAADFNLNINATTLHSGVTINDEISTKSQVNNYQLTTNKDGGIYITLDNLSDDINAQLLDSTGQTQIANFQTPLNSQFLEAKVPRGVYNLRIWAAKNGSSFTKISYTVTATFNDSDSENKTNLNKIIDNAYLLESGASFQGKLVSSIDVNYYKINTDSKGTINLRIEKQAAPIEFQLLDKNYNEVKDLKNDLMNNRVLETQVPWGTYYIKVKPLNWNNTMTDGSYTITAIYPTAKVTHNQNFEPNDTIETAYRLHSGIEYPMNLTSNVDTNYYKVVLNDEDQLVMSFKNITNPIIVQLLDENGASLGFDYPDSTRLFNQRLPKGTYYLKVTAAPGWTNQSTSTFTMEANFPENNNTTVNMNGVPLTFDQPPVISDGRTLVPLRKIMESLGAKVSWDDATQTVTATKGDTTVILTIGSTSAEVNGQFVTLDVPGVTMNGRTLVPLRFIGESLKTQVDWDKENFTININTSTTNK